MPRYRNECNEMKCNVMGKLACFPVAEKELNKPESLFIPESVSSPCVSSLRGYLSV